VPAEDARYALAIYSTTNDQLSINARELTYLKLLAKETVPEVVRRVIGQIVEEASKVSPGFFEDRGENCNILNYFPASQLFGGTNPNIKRYREHFNRTETVFVGYSGIELEDLSGAIKNKRTSELADLKHIHFTFLAPESLASFHQSTRQRTWNQSVETLSQSLTKKSRVTPAGVRERGYVTRFEESVQRKYDIYEDMLEEGLPPNEIGGVVAHAHVVYVLIHLNGWNVIKSLPSRRCDKVQWEIRESADEMARIIDVLNPELGYFSQPNCRRFGYCRERNPCEKKDIYLRSFKMGLS
jgi:thymidylate synthase (FAD)